MFNGQKDIVVMPTYNAALALRRTFDEVMAQDNVDLVIVVDDKSSDETVSIASKLPNVIVYSHDRNRGYGGNQKTCYKLALEVGGDIIIMVHPDYQYTPKLIPAISFIQIFHFKPSAF
jgi:glycosyltransferase involved in cell wall biosynthesis